MTYILILLIFMSADAVTPTAMMSVVAEFNTRDACWDALSAIIDPPRREYPLFTQATCAPKGQQGFGQ